MVRHGFRAGRMALSWLGVLFGGVCLIAGGGAPAALTLSVEPPMPQPVLIQERPEAAPETARGQAAPPATPAGSFRELHEALAAARVRLEELSKAAAAVVASGRLRQELAKLEAENQRLLAQLEAARAGDRELEDARQAAEARALELSQALEQATAEAQRIDQELIATRWENAQLNTSLAQTRAARREDQVQARAAQEALRAQIEALEADGAEVARLRTRLEESERQLTTASSARADTDARLAELRSRVEAAEQETASVITRLAAAEEQLSAAEADAAAARQDGVLATQRAADLQRERDELRAELVAVAGQLERAEVANDRLGSQVAELRQAAGTATDAARQNLVAVEQQIKALNEALGTTVAIAGAPDDPAPAPPSWAASAAMASDQQPAAGGVDLDAIKGTIAPPPFDGEANLALLAGLPLEQRLHVQGLLADLDGTVDAHAVKVVVPGGLLFAQNGEEVPDSAHDTLAKVAEIIDLYGDREVRIVGHTDAVGDAAYNQALSERRAALVKQFFVDRFDLEGDRLVTEGMGEARPIASNATSEGRRANRRVEVLILD
jgi:outer membrane protein OmpA-like peptidoglycan-associated protein